MKNIKITKEIWHRLRQVKSSLNYNNYSKTINYLINAKPRSQKSLQEIRSLVDEIKPTLEEGITKKQSVIEIQCIQCSSSPFELNESVCNETGITCPFCGYIHSITIVQEDDKNENNIEKRGIIYGKFPNIKQI